MRSTLRPTYAVVCLTEVFPLVGVRIESFNMEKTTLKVASSKMVKHEKFVLTINTLSYH